MSLFGTRPEAVKMAPVVKLLSTTPDIKQTIVVTGQHREMLNQVLDVFAITPDVDLNLMSHGQSLAQLAARALQSSADAIQQHRPDLLLVQGDTTSAFVGGLAAAFAGIAVGHIEAGLRSFQRLDPFPEEINRRLLSVVADLNFAPTERSRQNLLAENIADEQIVVTGNTVVDALLSVADSPALSALPDPPGDRPGARMILVTLHRRESWGEPMEQMAQVLRKILDTYPDVEVLFPRHRNPIVRQAVDGVLGGHVRAHLVEPLDYLSFVKAMSRCHFIVTDSGGIQEEAPALGKPVLVLRETTERQEAIDAGTARLVGVKRENVLAAVRLLLDDEAVYQQMAHAAHPFGDGHASERIVHAIQHWSAARGHASLSTPRA
jgi:UDP-N-acetylglucosamine 2-epimerase (non-hydrolysing)